MKALSDILEDSVSQHFTAWFFINWEDPRDIWYLTTAWIECPAGEVLTRIRLEQRPLPESGYFRFAYGCIYAGKGDLEYDTIENDLTPYRGEVDSQQGNIHYLDRQIVRCPENSSSYLTAFTIKRDLEIDMVRYIYKCGKADLSSCEEKSTPKHEAKDFLLTNLEHLGIECYPSSALTKFQLRVEYEPKLLFWYEFTCCSPPFYGFIIHRDPSGNFS